MRFFLAFLGLILGSPLAQAYLYESNFWETGQSYLRQLAAVPTESVEDVTGNEKTRCQSRYEGMIHDGVLEMHIVIGYFDWTTGFTVKYQRQDYGYSPSVDPGAYAALQRLLTSRCPGRAQFCGFSQIAPYRFSKDVVIQKRKIKASVEMVFASVSEYLASNTGKYANEQGERSRAAEANFINALKTGDAVFYFGHSRNGGGPDFAPPVFIKGTNKVNYNGYYRVQRQGLKRMLTALSSGSHQPILLGLMSCDSKDHFLTRIREVAPRMGVILSKDVVKVEGVYTALIGAADAVLRGQCQRGFSKSIRMNSLNQRYITMDGVFD